jgi:hypothetical protein
MLYDLSNDELDNITKALNSVIEWAKDSKARMKDKQEYSGRGWEKMPSEFRADEQQEKWNIYHDKQKAQKSTEVKSEAYYKLKDKLTRVSAMYDQTLTRDDSDVEELSDDIETLKGTGDTLVENGVSYIFGELIDSETDLADAGEYITSAMWEVQDNPDIVIIFDGGEYSIQNKEVGE